MKKPAILYISAESQRKPEKSESYFIDQNFIKKLPKEIVLCYIIQFKGQAEEMKKAIEKSGRKIMGFQSVLGCTKLKTPYTIVLIGNGAFHALNLAKQNDKDILLYSNGSSIAIGKKEREEHQKKLNAGFNFFLHANNIGIIVSTKPGQNKIKGAEKLAKELSNKYPEKQFYIFISSTINLREFENFNIGFWINTACPGLADDYPKMLNSDDIISLL